MVHCGLSLEAAHVQVMVLCMEASRLIEDHKCTLRAYLLLLYLSGYQADTPITIKAEASSKADSRPN